MPQQAAGILIEPAASVACAIGTIPAATAAAAPPEEPPGEYSVFHGFSAGSSFGGSDVNANPSSGTAVSPKVISPDSWNFENKSLSELFASNFFLKAKTPPDVVKLKEEEPKSFPKKGTP